MVQLGVVATRNGLKVFEAIVIALMVFVVNRVSGWGWTIGIFPDHTMLKQLFSINGHKPISLLVGMACSLDATNTNFGIAVATQRLIVHPAQSSAFGGPPAFSHSAWCHV
jgi:hypothetical protein